MFETYQEPARPESDDYKPRDHFGNACVLQVTEFRQGMSTVNGPADAVFADVYDLTLGQLFRNVMLMGGAFVDGLKPYAGKGPVVIHWAKRTSSAGRPYAYPAAADQAMIDKATAVFANGNPFLTTIDGGDDAEAPF